MSSSSSFTENSDSAFVCGCREFMRSACVGEPFYGEHGGHRYCVLHYPDKKNSAVFDEALRRKLDHKDYNFRGVCFTEEMKHLVFFKHCDFRLATFKARALFSAIFEEKADFSSATFNDDADFSGARFKAAVDFSSAIFNRLANFPHAQFQQEADFRSTTFNGRSYFGDFSKNVDFTSATFTGPARFHNFYGKVTFENVTFNARADFSWAIFHAKTDFTSATFMDVLKFEGNEMSMRDFMNFKGPLMQVFDRTASLDLRSAKIKNPELVSFKSLELSPHWFVDVDPRKFDLINVSWRWQSIRRDIKALRAKNVLAPHRMLSITYRRLAINAEDNHRYEEASKFRYLSMDTRRRDAWFGLTFWRLSWWYWLASGYGERSLRAFAMLICMWFGFAALFSQVECVRPLLSNHVICMEWAEKPTTVLLHDFPRSLAYTLSVMAFQKPEPHPVSPAAQILVTFCTILGPTQAALLALAIRRKFMR